MKKIVLATILLVASFPAFADHKGATYNCAEMATGYTEFAVLAKLHTDEEKADYFAYVSKVVNLSPEEARKIVSAIGEMAWENRKTVTAHFGAMAVFKACYQGIGVET